MILGPVSAKRGDQQSLSELAFEVCISASDDSSCQQRVYYFRDGDKTRAVLTSSLSRVPPKNTHCRWHVSVSRLVTEFMGPVESEVTINLSSWAVILHQNQRSRRSVKKRGIQKNTAF